MNCYNLVPYNNLKILGKSHLTDLVFCRYQMRHDSRACKFLCSTYCTRWLRNCNVTFLLYICLRVAKTRMATKPFWVSNSRSKHKKLIFLQKDCHTYWWNIRYIFLSYYLPHYVVSTWALKDILSSMFHSSWRQRYSSPSNRLRRPSALLKYFAWRLWLAGNLQHTQMSAERTASE
jgi:hypothetical protein